MIICGDCQKLVANVWKHSCPERGNIVNNQNLMNNQPASDWVSVNDMLPEAEVPVLVWTAGRSHEILNRQTGQSAGLWILARDGAYVSVTHWMPLPEPPCKS